MGRAIGEMKNLKGSVGNLVYYQRNGVTYIRTKPERYRDAKTEKQLTARGRFYGCNKFYKLWLMDDMLKHVWKTVAEGTRMNPANMFMKHNFYAFGKCGGITNYERLHFSAGLLPMPDKLQVGRYNDRDCILQWDFDPLENIGQPDDRLYIVEFDESRRPEIHNTGACRSEGKTTFSTFVDVNKQMHLYCFWGNKEETSFSGTHYFNEIPLIG